MAKAEAIEEYRQEAPWAGGLQAVLCEPAGEDGGMDWTRAIIWVDNSVA